MTKEQVKILESIAEQLRQLTASIGDLHEHVRREVPPLSNDIDWTGYQWNMNQIILRIREAYRLLDISYRTAMVTIQDSKRIEP